MALRGVLTLTKAQRQYAFSLLAGVTYLIIHEGTHLIQALMHHIFQGIRFNGLGVEVLITEPLTIGGWKLACFSGLSSIVTVGIGYILYGLAPAILSIKSFSAKGYLYYVTLVFLLLDPLYVSVFSFFVGGDINGIAAGLGVPYMAIRIVFFVVFGLNLLLVIKALYPKYMAAANRTN